MENAGNTGYATDGKTRETVESGDVAAGALRDEEHPEILDGANAGSNVDATRESAVPFVTGVMPVVPISRGGLGHDVPSRRLSLLVEGRDYLKYRETFERLLFAERMTPAQKDARIMKLAMSCLIERMDAMSAETGDPFLKAEMLTG